ncbi:tRNA (guanine(37)-n1)-methyltransferase [Plakobranchus ocellatus]|uniref:tRNA (guanine(37)-N1)-methyltransferase n=1 Tax=Plakobranchus ocellatus TaxID=259542 RepID=A0AAV3YLI0_9GAST|nr:tRNA (guanine(37)-n1)-methyltransferase [Plakobranchus ocellatus]
MTNFFFKSVCRIFQESDRVLCRLDRKTLKIDDRFITKFRYILSNLRKGMSNSEARESLLFTPPHEVRGLTKLTRAAFAKSVKIPGLKVPKKEIARSQKIWKPLVLKLAALKPIAELSDRDPLKESHSLILLDPRKLKDLSTQQIEMLEGLGLNMEKPDQFEVELGYENWSVADVMRAVLPCEMDNVTSYTQVGHIAHLNLKPETLPFKNLIGEVILDKVPSVKTVVNKLNTIDNTYRNFSMELLAGEDNFVTQTKEHNCLFELDFSKVYWNSRLATEHQRIVDLIPKESVVYDVFAGVGPFAIPLAKKKHCIVFANDLNPASYTSLQKNITLNNIKQGCVNAWNLDGREFILTVMKKNLEERLEQLLDVQKKRNRTNSSESNTGNSDQSNLPFENTKNDKYQADVLRCSYVIMNLPAIAVEFLSSLRSFLHDTAFAACMETEPHLVRSLMPQVYCYAFSPKEDINTELKKCVEESLGCPVPDDYSTRLVRNVAPNKEMICISFKIWPELVLSSPNHRTVYKDRKRECGQDEACNKRQRLMTD